MNEKRHVTLPSSWSIKKLIEVVDVSPKYSVPEQNDYAYLPMDAVDKEKMNPNYWERRIREDLTPVKFKEGDLLFAKITPSTEHGKGALIRNFEEQIGFCSTELVVLSPKEEILPEYLFYYTKLDSFRNRAVSLMEGATGRQRVPKYFFKTQSVSVPPIQEQISIVSILQNIDSIIQTTQYLIDNLKMLKKGFMQRLLTKGNEHVDFKETKLGCVPEEWSIMKMKNLIYLKKGIKSEMYEEKSCKDNLPYLSAEYLRGEGELKKWVNLSEKSVRSDENCLILIWDGSNAGSFFLGERGVVSSTMSLISLKSDAVTLKFLYYFCKYYEPKIKSRTNGTSIPHVDRKLVEEFHVVLPTIEEQKKITHILHNLQNQIQNNILYIKKMKEIKNGMMQDLLTGEKRFKTN